MLWAEELHSPRFMPPFAVACTYDRKSIVIKQPRRNASKLLAFIYKQHLAQDKMHATIPSHYKLLGLERKVTHLELVVGKWCQASNTVTQSRASTNWSTEV